MSSNAATEAAERVGLDVFKVADAAGTLGDSGLAAGRSCDDSNNSSREVPMIRTNLTRLFLLLACALAFAGCGPKAPVADSGADVAALTSAAAGWEQAYNDKDADALAAIYAEDAQLLPQGAPAVNGRAAIREYYANDIATGWAKVSVASDANGVAGDWAWRSGTWSAEFAPPVSGKYLEVWHRTAEGWRLYRDISNLDVPEAPNPQ